MGILDEHFERVTRSKEDISPIGWFSYGGNHRVKHLYINDGTALCGQSSIRNLTDRAKKRINPNPYARVHNKCATCKRKMKSKKFFYI